MRRYVKINLPIEIAEKIKPFLREFGGNYRGYSEFTLEAVRLRLEQLSVKESEVQ